jgi:hypothetical protein
MAKKHAIIIPYRNREEHLPILLNALYKYKDDADIYIFEQNNNNLFNRGYLFNSINNIDIDYEYYIFHDVDLIPEVDVNYIRDYLVPTHLSCYVEQFNYKLVDNVSDYKQSEMFGGVIAMSKTHFDLVYGFSNLFEGWGYEDNDMIRRIKNEKLHIDRLPWSYKSLKHDRNNNVYDNLINNKFTYDNCNYCYKHIIDKNMKLIKEYDNVKHYLVNVPINDNNCVIIYDNLLNDNDLILCLLSAYQIGYSVLLSHYHITQSTFNYYKSKKHSIEISENVKFIHYSNLLLYILNKKAIYSNIPCSICTIPIYNYSDHSYNDRQFTAPHIEKNIGFNYFIYKLLNPDLSNLDQYELIKHYINEGKQENRPMSFNLVKEFNIFTYYECNKDLRYMNIFNRDKNISCLQLINHYINIGCNENRIICNKNVINIQNVDWLYLQYNITAKLIYTYYDMIENYKSKIPILKYIFPCIKSIKNDRVLIITHPGGGGVEKYLNMLVKCFPDNLILKPNSVDNTLYEIDNMFFHYIKIIELYEYICSHNIKLIIINHMSIYTPQMFQMFEAIKKNFECKSIVVLHDITYLGNNRRTTFNLYRNECLDKANLIIAPSKYIQNYYKRGILMPHPDMHNHVIKAEALNEGEEIKILVFGHNKGSHNIMRFLKDDRKNCVTYLGYNDMRNDRLYKLGSYEDKELELYIKEINPHIIWFPSKKPEAYCYALSYAMLSGIPIVAYKVGANIERLCNRPLTWLTRKPLTSIIDYLKSQLDDKTIYEDEKIYMNEETYFKTLFSYISF